jgi:hypothetical protein
MVIFVLAGRPLFGQTQFPGHKLRFLPVMEEATEKPQVFTIGLIPSGHFQDL